MGGFQIGEKYACIIKVWPLIRISKLLKRISRHKPAPTITASGGCIHCSEMRKLALCESQRAMSLPDDFKLTGKWEQRSERMGRMVPPLMMKAIADSVYENVLKPYKEKTNG